ncbi:MAG: SGNH/GDSL hydrolase family protein [Planctomycetota bacterium]
MSDNAKAQNPMKPKSKGRLFFRLFFAGLWMLFLLVFLMEVVVRFIPFPGLTMEDLNPAYLQSTKTHRTMPHPYLAYCLKPGWHTPEDSKAEQKSHNLFGLRGPEIAYEKPAGAYRIVCLGGSSTYGNSPSCDEATWPARLEHRLREAYPDKTIEVINGGAPGWSTFESTVNLAFRMVDFAPDLVIVYHSINDMRCALYKEPRPDNTHWRQPWPTFRPSPLEPILEKSICYLVWRKYCTRYLEDRSDINFNAIVDPPPGNTDWYASDAAKISPVGFKSFRRNLVSIAAIARAHGAKVMFGTQALDEQDITSPKSGANQIHAMHLMSRILKEVASEQKIMLVDAEKTLEDEARKQAGDPGKAAIFTWEVHLTDEGADLLAKTFAERILSEKLID